MTIERGCSNSAPADSGSQPAGRFSSDVRTRTQPGLRLVTARIVGDLNSVLVLIVPTTLPWGAVRSWVRWRTWKASAPRSLGSDLGLAAVVPSAGGSVRSVAVGVASA